MPYHLTKTIQDFGKDKYGTAMFFPNSDEWHKQQKTN